MAKSIILRQWRMTEASPSGMTVWFDPARETVELFELEPSKDSRVADAVDGDDQLDMYDPEVDKNELGELPF